MQTPATHPSKQLHTATRMLAGTFTRPSAPRHDVATICGSSGNDLMPEDGSGEYRSTSWPVFPSRCDIRQLGTGMVLQVLWGLWILSPQMKHRTLSPAPFLPARTSGTLTVDIPDLHSDDSEFRSPFRRKCFNSRLERLGVVVCLSLTAWCVYLAIRDPNLSTIPLFTPDAPNNPSWFAQSLENGGPLLAIPNKLRFEPLLCRWSCRYMPHGSSVGTPMIEMFDSLEDALQDVVSGGNASNAPLTATVGSVIDGSPHWLADVHTVDIFLENKHGYDPLCRLCGVANALQEENYTSVVAQPNP